jgi:hypothetical protein
VSEPPSSSDADAVLGTLADRAAIYDVLVSYVHGLDRHDWGLVASCFTVDATASYESIQDIGPGRDELLAFLQGAGWEQSRDRGGVLARVIIGTTHVVGNVLTEIDGDVARVQSSAIAYIARGANGNDPDELLMRGVRYIDRFVRSGQRWQIAHRTHTADWQVNLVPAFALPRSEQVIVR